MAVIIAVGISLYIGITTAFFNLSQSQQGFYQDNNFADYYFYVVRAPESILKQVERVPGVSLASGRIQKDVPVLKENQERATVRLTSYGLPLEKGVNGIELMQGRFFIPYPAGGGIEAMLNSAYFEANGLAFGDTIDIVADNRKYPIKIVGTAAGPEFTYIMKDAANMMPDHETFGIMMLPLNQAQHLFHLPGQFNQVLVQFAPGVDQDAVVQSIKDILAPYGNLASFPRKDQLSHAALEGELEGLEAISAFLPLVFLSIAAAIQFVILRRMIKSQRSQIGIMKALGFHNAQIIVHFSSYAILVCAGGAAFGIGTGVLMASYFSDLYAMFFNLPRAIGGVNYQVILYSILLSLGVGALAGFSASRPVLSINPAESMRPLPPTSSSRSLVENWNWLWTGLSSSWKMAFRTISRNRFRMLVSILGISSAVALLILSMFTNDAVDYLMDQHFNRESNYDYMLSFNHPIKESELLDISRLEGVGLLEGYFTLPIRVHLQGSSDEDVLVGIHPSSTLKQPTREDGTFIPIPQEGMVISRRAAERLGLQVGDTVQLETLLGLGPNRYAQLKIVAVNYQLFGNESYVSLAQANRILQESQLINGALMKVDPKQAAIIEKELSDMTGINSIVSRQKERDNIMSMMDSMIYMVSVMIMFSVILGFVIVYNSAVMSFNERKRELASLLTIGFTRQEVAVIMWKETIPQALPALLLGLPLGKFLAELYFGSVQFDMWYMPVVIYPLSYALAALGGLVFVILGQWAASRGIKKLDIIELSKNTD
jgi:putative ABC transport system permease protein